jgi:hypothetical protein
MHGEKTQEKRHVTKGYEIFSPLKIKYFMKLFVYQFTMGEKQTSELPYCL